MKVITLLFAFWALFAVLSTQVFAQDDISVDEVEEDGININVEEDSGSEDAAVEATEAETKHYLTDLPPALESVESYYVIPHYPSMIFPAGEEIEVLLAFQNKDEEKSLNVSMIGASLNVPQEFSYYVQNYTAFEYGSLVEPNEQISLLYSFTPDAALEQRDFQIAVTVFYSDAEDIKYSTTFLNHTIEIGNPIGGLDSRTFFTYLLGFGFVLLVVLVVYRTMSAPNTTKYSKRSNFAAASEESVDNEWGQDILRANTPRSKTPTKRKSKK